MKRVVTYMRTDSTNLSKQAVEAVQNISASSMAPPICRAIRILYGSQGRRPGGPSTRSAPPAQVTAEMPEGDIPSPCGSMTSSGASLWHAR